ncbi:MAG: HDOD domain-containing protein [Chloroflexi bacterium]|nr:HDOD domain-containing protein [Chloroflexota bacterium]
MLSVVPRGPLPSTPEQLVTSAPELEALPVVAQRLFGLVRDPNATIEAMARLLGTDQALVASVLRYANSARAMPNRRIASLPEAIARIGLRTLGEVVVRACAAPVLDRGLPPYALPRRIAWRHSATVSEATRGLARLARIGATEEASVAGLLHDVGKFVLTSVVPEAAAEAVSVARSRRIPVWQAETQVIGFHHGHVGGALLRSWGLPEHVAAAVAFHHEPDQTDNQLATVVAIADAAAHAVGAVGSGGACPQPDWDPAAAGVLGAGVNPEQLEQFLDSLRCVEAEDL